MNFFSGHYIRVVRTGTHAKHGRVLMLIDFWKSEEDFKAGKAGIRHDCTFGFGGQKHPNPGPAVMRRIVHAIDSLIAGGSVDPEIIANWKDGHDPEGNWAHESMRQFDAVSS
jgi:hypothetical protein